MWILHLGIFWMLIEKAAWLLRKVSGRKAGVHVQTKIREADLSLW